MINIINNEINKYTQLNKDYSILLQNNPSSSNILKPYYHDEYLSYTNKFSSGNFIKIKDFNKLSIQSIQLLSFLTFINIKKILVISHNIYFILPILYNKLNNNYKITFIVINTINIDQIIYLKKTFNELIDIYYIGFNYDYESYSTIIDILKNETFTTIIIDYGRSYSNYEKCVVISLLILDKFLSDNGCFIDYFLLQPNLNDRILKIMNLVYNCFYNHNSNDTYITWNSKYTYPDSLYIYNNIKSRLSSDVKEKLIYFLQNDILDDSITNYKLTDDFLQNLYTRWLLLIIKLEENFKRVQQILLRKSKRINFKYHQNKINNKNIIDKIPETIDDISYIDKQIDNIYVQTVPTSSYKDKRLLLLYIQVLTKCNNVTNIILYSSSKNNFLPILYNLFPNITWYINKYEKNSENILKHPDKNKVILYNDIKDLNLKAPTNTDDNKTLFISNYYDKNISKIENMKNQASLGINLNADYLLINIYLLNENEKIFVDYPKKYSDLNFKNIRNNDLFTTFNFLFLKGEILLDLYSSVKDKKLNLNLFIEKNNNLFELKIYDFVSLYNKIIYYNIYVKTSFICDTNNEVCKVIPLEYINLLPGYDTSLECIMEYQIISNFYQKNHSISDTKIIVNKMFDINFLLEKLSKKYFIMSIHRTVTKQLNNTSNNDYDKYIRLYYWKNISLYNISFSAKYQIDYITNNGNKIYTEERIEQCINYLKQFIQKKLYYNLKNIVL
jgi:hypothetical protein